VAVGFNPAGGEIKPRGIDYFGGRTFGWADVSNATLRNGYIGRVDLPGIHVYHVGRLEEAIGKGFSPSHRKEALACVDW
jgi:hypothetical protein